jgi:mono/diheme cytochrome c family protein
MRLFLPIAGLAVCFCAALAQRPSQETQPPRQDYNSGEYLYRAFCASCHGSRGRGDGPVAGMLRVAPPDLTSIARRNGGSFPRDRVLASIDGRQAVRGHGSAEMPVWGDVLKRTEGQNETVVRSRLAALVSHLESLQSAP